MDTYLDKPEVQLFTILPFVPSLVTCKFHPIKVRVELSKQVLVGAAMIETAVTKHTHIHPGIGRRFITARYKSASLDLLELFSYVPLNAESFSQIVEVQLIMNF